MTIECLGPIMPGSSPSGGVPFPTFSISPIRVVDTDVVYPDGGPGVRVGFRVISGVSGFEKLHDFDEFFVLDECPNQPQWMDVDTNLILYAVRVVWIDPLSNAELDVFPDLGVWTNTNITTTMFIKRVVGVSFLRYIMQVADSGDLSTILGQATYTITSTVLP